MHCIFIVNIFNNNYTENCGENMYSRKFLLLKIQYFGKICSNSVNLTCSIHMRSSDQACDGPMVTSAELNSAI